MAAPESRTRGGLAVLPLRSRTIRAGLGLALVGGAAMLYATYRDAEPGALANGGALAARIGLSLAGGYLIGWLFRRVRFAALTLLALLLGAAFALRHFGVFEGTAAEAELREAADRALGGASRLKELAQGALPSSVTAAVGGLLGYVSGRPARGAEPGGRQRADAD